MGKLEYLDALKRAMTGLDPELQAKTLAYYEQRFVDGETGGRTEADVAAELDDPKKIAMTLRANTHLKAFEEKKNPANAARVLVAFAGLAVFNLFMLVPAVVFASLLVTLYATGLAFYASGVIITASGLSGANELVLDGPLRNVVVLDDDRRRDRGRHRGDTQTKVSISADGINIYSEPKDSKDGVSRTSVSINEDIVDEEKINRDVAREMRGAVRETEGAIREAQGAVKEANELVREAAANATAAATAVGIAEAEAAAAEASAEAADESDTRRSTRVIKRAESVGENGIVISTAMDDESRATQTIIGFALVLGGILLLLLGLVVTKYTIIGIKRYVQMNLALLKGN